jgi:hypothetical protein
METGPPKGPGDPPSMFFMLMVGAPGSPPAPRGSVIDVFDVDGGRSRISVSTLQGAHHRRLS